MMMIFMNAVAINGSGYSRCCHSPDVRGPREADRLFHCSSNGRAQVQALVPTSYTPSSAGPPRPRALYLTGNPERGVRGSLPAEGRRAFGTGLMIWRSNPCCHDNGSFHRRGFMPSFPLCALPAGQPFQSSPSAHGPPAPQLCPFPALLIHRKPRVSQQKGS